MRRLLPYERALIDTLGITEEEYFRFLALQEEYKDIKDGTILDAQMGLEAATLATISLVLTVLGTAASVLAVLLAPTPEIPSQRAGRQRRETRFAPRFGFDNIQEAAAYGEPVNLVYCNKTVNPKGGTRVNTSLIWAAVESFGNSQYMQTLSVIGSDGIMEIDDERTAFGQVPSRQFVGPGKWQYFNDGGAITFADLIDGGNADPAREGKANADLVYTPGTKLTEKQPGFSQTFSPSSFAVFGVESPIPINVLVYERRSNGQRVRANNQVDITNRSIYWPNVWGVSRPQFPLNHSIALVLASDDGAQNGPAKKQALEDRLRYAASVDSSSIYKLGSAKFEVTSISGDETLDSTMTVGMVCTEPGFGPEEDYAATSRDIEDAKDDARMRLNGASEESVRNVQKGEWCRIVTRGGTNFRALGSPNNSVGTLFKATRDATFSDGDGTVQIYETQAEAALIPVREQLAAKEYELANNSLVYYTDLNTIQDEAALAISESKYKIQQVADLIDYNNLSRSQLDEFAEIAFGDNGVLRPAAESIRPYVDAINEHEKNIADQQQYIATREAIRSKYANGVVVGLPLEDIFIGDYKVTGVTCKIVASGNTNFTLMGAPNSNVGTTFTATAPGTGTGLVSITLPLPALQEIDSFIGNAKSKIARNQDNMKKQQMSLQDGLRRLGAKNANIFDLRQTVSFSQFGQTTFINVFNEVREIINNVQDVPNISRLNLSQRWFTRLQQVLDQRSARQGLTTIDVEKNFLNRLLLRIGELQTAIAEAKQIDDAATTALQARLTAEIDALKNEVQRLKAIIDSPDSYNDSFAVKALAKITQASYETVTNCNIVNFAMKARAFMRIQGRSKQYGEEDERNYRLSDNGVKRRSAFFLMWYKYPGQNGWTLVPVIFTLSRSADNDTFFSLYFKSNTTQKWRFKFEPVSDTAAEIRKHNISQFAYIFGNRKSSPINLSIAGKSETISFYGVLRNKTAGGTAPRRKSPYGLDEWMLFNYSSDQSIQFSFDNGPEFEITSITEQQQLAASTYAAQYPIVYRDVSLIGFNCFSGKGLRGLRSLSVFVNKGKKASILPSSPLSNEPSDAAAYVAGLPLDAANYAPDVFLDTIKDAKHGIGKYADLRGVNFSLLTKAKQMCVANGYFMDGVIADLSSWREFWANAATFSLLEFARIGGQDTLIPALPVNANGIITRDVTISAMFNQGNILEDSYREDFLDYGDATQDIIANVIYKEEGGVGMEMFPRNTSVTVSLAGVTDANAVRKTFDLSQFVTTRKQALHYGMLMCQQRRHIKRSIEFKTFPSEAPVSPGSYIYVQTDENRWDNLSSGKVEAGNVLSSPASETIANGTYRMLLFDGVNEVKTFASISVSNGVASSLGGGYTGWLFVLGTQISNKRVFRVTEVEMAEEGEITIRAIEHPCQETVSGSSIRTLSLIADQTLSLYTITD